MQQLTKQEAIDFAESDIWKDWDIAEIARFQLFQDRLCVPFDVFHEGIEVLLDRPVGTHEFANQKRLQDEYLTNRPAPTDVVVCPGCGWTGLTDDLGEYGSCPMCAYENGVEPYRLLTLNEILTRDDMEYTDVKLNLFLQSVLNLMAGSSAVRASVL